MVLLAPLVPFFPLVTAHPAKHEWDSLFVGEFDNVFAGNFGFPAKNVHSEILHVAKNVGFASFVVLVEKVRRIHTAAHQKVLAVYLEVEIAAFADAGKLFIGVTELRDLAYSEAQMRSIRDDCVFGELEAKVIQIRCSHGVWPPEIRISEGYLRKLFR